MPITDRFVRFPLDQIIIQRETRQRRSIDTKGLIDSIRQLGVLHPVIIDQNYVLVAGERRVAASRELGLADIPVRFVEDLSEVEAKIIELEENAKRLDLSWQDNIKAVADLHSLHVKLDPDWTMGETAAACSLSTGAVSMYLTVQREIEINPRALDASTVREAYNTVQRRESRMAGDALEELIATSSDVLPFASPATNRQPASPGTPPPPPLWPSPEETILPISFLDWAPSYEGKRFNLVHCDFPYGVGLFNGPQAGGERSPDEPYDDSAEVYFELLECFCKNLSRFMAPSSHLMFWYSAKHHDRTMQMFHRLAPSLVFAPFPLVWVKSDNAGIVSDVRRQPRHVYETCLFAAQSRRQLVKVVSDAYSAPTDKRFHVSTKPEPMLRHFMSMLVDENTSLLDPTCGGGSAIRAAEDLGAGRVLGLEIDPKCAEIAQRALRNARGLRQASKAL